MYGPVTYAGNFNNEEQYNNYLQIWQTIADNVKISGGCSWEFLQAHVGAFTKCRTAIGGEGVVFCGQRSVAQSDCVASVVDGVDVSADAPDDRGVVEGNRGVHSVSSECESRGDVGDRVRETLVGTGPTVGKPATKRRMTSAQKNKKEKARRDRRKGKMTPERDVADGVASKVDLSSGEIPTVDSVCGKCRSRGGKVDLPAGEIPAFMIGRNGKPVKEDGVGFWKSCSEETRLKLIESKAQMHISENLRKAKENEDRIEYLNSTQAIVDRVTKLVGKAEEMAKDANDNRVLGWAKTVTSSSAESLAKTVPESVPSLSSYTSEADASELDKVKRALTEEKEIAVAEYKLRHDRIRATLDEKTQEVEQLKADIAAIKRKPVVEASHGGKDKNLVYSVRSMPMSEVERAAVTHGVVTDVELVAARVRFGRQVTGDDFLAHKSGFNLSTAVAGKIAEAYERQIGKFKRNQVPYNFLN